MISDAKKQEKEFLYDWTLTIYQFFEENIIMPDEDAKKILVFAMNNASLRGLREAANDFTKDALDLPIEHQEKLNAILREKFGIDLKTMKLHDKKRLNRVLKRGYLKSDDEFRMVEYWVNEYCQAGVPDDEIDPLNALLSDYERRVEAKWAAKKAAKEARNAEAASKESDTGVIGR